MSDLSNILMSMDESLFEETEDDALLTEGASYGESVYEEDISPALAHALIGGAFDPSCSYKMVAMPECTLVLKIDDRVTPDMENEHRRRVTEFELKSDEVQSLDDMHKEMLGMTCVNIPAANRVVYDKGSFYKLTWMERVLVIAALLLLCIFFASLGVLLKLGVI